MIDSGIEAILVKVAALGLDPLKHLGKSLQQVRYASPESVQVSRLHSMSKTDYLLHCHKTLPLGTFLRCNLTCTASTCSMAQMFAEREGSTSPSS